MANLAIFIVGVFVGAILTYGWFGLLDHISYRRRGKFYPYDKFRKRNGD